MYKYCKIFPAFILFLSISFTQLKAEEVLSWQDCIQEAAKNHPDLISSQEGVKQSEASKEITASTLFPQINSNLGATTTQTAGTATDSYTYGVSGTQLVFDGFKTADNVKAATENIKAAQYNYKFTSSAVRLRLRAAFINLLKAQELLNITQEI